MTLRDVRRAYDESADAWSRDVERVYQRFAMAMLDQSPVEVSGALVLDVGAGTAVASRIALGLGARGAVASDVSERMLRHRGPDVLAVLADAGRLPFADDTFDLAVAACLLGHLPDPARALREARRVSRGVLATAFADGGAHPAKAAVDRAMAELGFVPPAWYAEQKKDDTAAELEPLAHRAGCQEVTTTTVSVNLGLDSPGQVARWRLGMAHLAPFIAGLSASERTAAERAAERAVADLPPVVIDLVVLSAR